MVETKEDLYNIRIGMSRGGLKVDSLWFTDDKDLVCKDEVELQELTDRLNSTAKRLPVEINKEKCRTMVTGIRNDNISLEVKVEEYKLEQVKSFAYQGATTAENGTSEEKPDTESALQTSAVVFWTHYGTSDE